MKNSARPVVEGGAWGPLGDWMTVKSERKFHSSHQLGRFFVAHFIQLQVFMAWPFKNIQPTMGGSHWSFFWLNAFLIESCKIPGENAKTVRGKPQIIRRSESKSKSKRNSKSKSKTDKSSRGTKQQQAVAGALKAYGIPFY